MIRLSWGANRGWDVKSVAEPAKTKGGVRGRDSRSVRSPEMERQLTFGEHLEELRGHVLRSVIVLSALVVVCFIVQDTLAAIVMQPFFDAREWLNAQGREIKGLTYIDPAEGIFFHLKIAFYGALILGLPYFVWEMWRFIASGLYPHERRVVTRVLPVSFGLLVTGVVFAYFVVLPIALKVLLGYGNPDYIQPEIRLESYLGFFVMLSLLLGAVFQLPLVQVVFARVGIVSAKVQAEKRRVFILGSVVVSAVVTPTGDAVTLLLVSVPIFILYEIGIVIARRADRARAKTLTPS